MRLKETYFEQDEIKRDVISKNTFDQVISGQRSTIATAIRNMIGYLIGVNDLSG